MATQTPEHGRVIYLAIELSSSIWLVAAHLPGAAKPKLHRIGAGDTAALLALVTSLRAHVQAGLGAAVEVASCFEAGRDGFWLHRLLMAHGIASHVLEPTSVLVNRRARRAKTDRLDAQVPAARADGDSPATGRPAAWCGCRRPRRRMPQSACTASASIWCRRGFASRTGSRRCWRPRASGRDPRCVHGSATSPRSVPVTDASCRRISGGVGAWRPVR